MHAEAATYLVVNNKWRPLLDALHIEQTAWGDTRKGESSAKVGHFFVSRAQVTEVAYTTQYTSKTVKVHLRASTLSTKVEALRIYFSEHASETKF